MVVAVVVAVVVLAVIVIVILSVSRRRADPVDSFRRQIDALSPEARRPTISQATNADSAPDDDAVDETATDAVPEADDGGPDDPPTTGDPDGT